MQKVAKIAKTNFEITVGLRKGHALLVKYLIKVKKFIQKLVLLYNKKP
jgi:hypothetical protein